MERLERIASHPGTVKGVKPGVVTVEIEATSACASCAAHSRCGFAESKNKTLDIPVDAESGIKASEFKTGDSVTVHIDESRGMLAVWIAYVLPALAMLAVIVALSAARMPEWLVALAALLALGIYIGILYIMKGKIGKRFTLYIEKKVNC